MKKTLIVLTISTILILGIGVTYYQIRWSLPQKEIAKIKSEINSVINIRAGNATSCKVAPIGNKACGGPAGFIIYSEETTDVVKLQDLLSRYYDLVVKFQEKNGGNSTCDVETPPESILQDGYCIATEPKLTF